MRYYIIRLNEAMELSELKFILFNQKFKSLNAFYYNQPILIDRENKTFENFSEKEIKLIKDTFNLKNIEYKELTLNEYKKSKNAQTLEK